MDFCYNLIMFIRICPYCAKEFLAKRKERMFCSKVCGGKNRAPVYKFIPNKLSPRQRELQKLICEPTAKGKDYKDYLKVI